MTHSKMTTETARLYEKVCAFEESRSDQIPSLSDRWRLCGLMAADGILKEGGEVYNSLQNLYQAIAVEVFKAVGPFAAESIGYWDGPIIKNGVPADFEITVNLAGRELNYKITIF